MDLEVVNYLTELEKNRRYSSHTIRAYKKDLEQYLTHLHHREKTLLLANSRDIRDFIYELYRNKITSRTVNRKFVAIKGLYRHLRKIGLIKEDPTEQISAPKEQRLLPQPISEEVLFQVLDSAPLNSPLKIRDRALVELLYATGMRLSELEGLNLSSISNRFVRVLGKGNKERTIPLTRQAEKILTLYLSIRPSLVNAKSGTEAIFLSVRGQRLVSRDIARRVGQVLSHAAEKCSLNPHALRHSYATHLVNHGADIRIVKELLGHKNLSTTQIYTHVGIDHLRDVYNRAHPRADKEAE